MDNKLEWLFTDSKLEEKEILKVESAFHIKFPKDYIECIKFNNGGHPTKEIYDFEGHKEAVFNYLLSFNPKSNIYIVNVFEWIQDRLIEGIYPFADDPFGNFICFDYRKSKDNSPVIVFWDHEISSLDPIKSISLICKTFTELLSKLY